MGYKRSQAARTSSVVNFSMTSSTEDPFISLMSLEYSEPELIAELKMLGFVVTPTTADEAIREGNE
jgi:hypothetical protein